MNYFLSLGPDLGWRQFTDNESGVGPGRSYRAFPMPGFHVAMDLYPVFAGHLGVEGGYAMALGLHSKASDGQTLLTNFLRADGAVKVRFFTANRERSPWIAILVGYGYSRFTFDGGPTNRELPTAVYQMFRAGLDGRAPIDHVVLGLGGEYDRLTSIEPLGVGRPAASGNGVTVRTSLGFEITAGFTLRVEGRYSWLLFSLVRDLPSNVVDQYLTGSLSGELAF